MFILPTPDGVCSASTITDYHIVTFGDDTRFPYIITVMRGGRVHDSYVVVATGKYITLPFEKG